MTRPCVVIAPEGGDLLGAARRFASDRPVERGLDVPDEPYDLTSGAVRAATLREPDDVAAVVALVVRGASMVLAVEGLDRAAIADELSRIAEVVVEESGDQPSSAVLDDDERALLAELAGGASVPEAARRLGLSTRTAHRRLARARAALGAATTTEALLAAARLGEP